LDRPRDRPVRTALATGFLSWVGLIFFVGSSDRTFYVGISYTGQIHFWRIAVWIVPVLVFVLTRGVCRSSALGRTRCGPGREPSFAVAPMAS
jgi:ubiquinol-cytochrome c reductase cytochrome b subunit